MRDIAKRLTVARLEIEAERDQPGADPRRGRRAWQREYFAVEPLSPDDWEACQAACQELSREAAALFGIRFDHTSLEMEAAVGEEQGEKENSA